MLGLFLCSCANTAISDTASLLAPLNHADAKDSEPEVEEHESELEFEFDKEEEADNGSGENKEEAEDAAPTMQRKKSTHKGKSSWKSALPDLGSLHGSMGNLKVRDDLDLNFSFDWKVPVANKDYTKNNLDKFEVEFL